MQFSAIILLGLASAVSARPFNFFDLFKIETSSLFPLPTFTGAPTGTGTVTFTPTGTSCPTGTGTGIPIPTGTGTGTGLPAPTGGPSSTYHWPSSIPTVYI